MLRRSYSLCCLLVTALNFLPSNLDAQAPAIPPATAGPTNSAPEGKQPSVVTVDIFSESENENYFGTWMLYDSTAQSKKAIPWKGSKVGDEPATIYPNPNITDFGDAMCNLQATLCKQSKERDLFLIHVIDWQTNPDQIALDPKTNKNVDPPKMALVGSVTYLNSYWYFYQRDSTGVIHSIKPQLAKDGSYTLPNIYDIDNGYIISVSRLKTMSTEINLIPPMVSYTPTITTSLPNWLTGIETIVSKMTGVTIPAAPAAGGAGGPGARTDQYHKAFIKVQEISASSVKRPFSLAVTATASARTASSVHLLKANEQYAPADPTQTAPADNATSASAPQIDCSTLNPQGNCSFQASAAVQARDFVLFGIGVVPHGPSETDYGTNSSGVQTSTTSNRNNFYGLVDLTPCPVHCNMKTWPYLQLGLPLTGAAWHAPYIGAGIPIPWPWLKKTFPLSAFVGTIDLKQQTATGTTYTNWRPLWGIEVPLSSLASQIQSVTGNKKKGGGS
jgi:hypothetical protein